MTEVRGVDSRTSGNVGNYVEVEEMIMTMCRMLRSSHANNPPVTVADPFVDCQCPGDDGLDEKG